MSHTVKNIIAFIAVVIVAFACSSSYTTTNSKWNLASIYNPSASSLHPSYKVFHAGNMQSLLYVKIYNKELLFRPVAGQSTNYAKANLKFSLYEIGDKANTLVDSASIDFNIKDGNGNFFITQIPLKAELGKEYTLKLVLKDVTRKSFNLSFLEVIKRKENGEQFYNIVDTRGYPFFKNIVLGDKPFLVKHNNPGSDSLYISYFKNNLPTPSPVFAGNSSDYGLTRPDSMYIIKYSNSTPLSLSYEGVYFIQFDTNSTEGVSLSRFNKGFPKVASVNTLIEPLAYLTTNAEFKNLLQADNQKRAVDNFWLKAGENADKGRELIRIYYNRVYFANYYFSNIRPGWKTDRGMIYIVYGPPRDLKKTAGSETWIYKNRFTNEDIEINFIYSPTIYNVNNYRLNRSESQEWHWKEAVYSWTSGDIFYLN